VKTESATPPNQRDEAQNRDGVRENHPFFKTLLVVGKHLVNTSYDSGVLTLSDAERRSGWRLVGRLAHSPLIRSTDQIPHDQYDEWLVFDQPVQVEGFDTMVNYCGFTPVDYEWDEKRELFWEQIVRLRPLHVIAENDGVYLLSRDGDLVHRVIAASKAHPNALGV
jgi:hypothetical protein